MKLLKTGLLAALLMGAQPAASDTTILFNNFLSPNDALWTDVIAPWIADVERVTEGRVKFSIPAASLAPPPELLNSVQQGVADGAFQMVSFLRESHPELQLPLLPMTNFGNEETSVALWRTYETFFKGKNDMQDVELLGLVTTPPNSLINMKPTPFQSVADLQGVKFWSPPGLPAETLSALGAVVTPGPAVRMYEVISGGVVDAFCCINYESLEVFNVAQYIGAGTDIPGHMFAPAFAIFIRSDVMAGISADDQAKIRDVSGEVISRRSVVGDPSEAAARERMVAAGKTIVPASDAFVAELETAIAPVRAGWIEAVAAKGIDAQAALDFYLAEQAKITAGN
jgi:TRAP-type C4-dicarboxylate transport system substrate-binding protein